LELSSKIESVNNNINQLDTSTSGAPSSANELVTLLNTVDPEIEVYKPKSKPSKNDDLWEESKLSETPVPSTKKTFPLSSLRNYHLLAWNDSIYIYGGEYVDTHTELNNQKPILSNELIQIKCSAENEPCIKMLDIDKNPVPRAGAMCFIHED